MSVPSLSPAATLVRQLDPDLFHAALFAPEPARERLMVLYAFDIELSKAAVRSAEPMMARIRLQWWRDLLAGIEAGDAPRKHDVAAPLHKLILAQYVSAGDLTLLIDARETELNCPMNEPRFADWIDGRFAALTRLAVHLLTSENIATRRAATAVGHAMGVGFALRHAVAMAEENLFLLPGLTTDDRSELARGSSNWNICEIAQRQAEPALTLLAAARAERRAVPRPATPALLPVWRAERELKRSVRPGLDLQRDLSGQGGRGIAFTWRALRGRW